MGNRNSLARLLADLGVIVLLAGMFAFCAMAYLDAGALREMIVGLVRR